MENQKPKVYELSDKELIEQCKWWKHHINDVVTMVPDNFDYNKTELFTELVDRFEEKSRKE